MSNFNFIVLFVLSIVRRKYLVNIIRKHRIRIVTYKLVGYSVGLLCVFLILSENDKCLNTVDLVDRIYFSKSRCCIISESLVEIYLVNIVTFVFDIPT